jgi:cystathionine beta-lyase
MEVLLMKSCFDFNKPVERRGTDSVKWDLADDDVIPMWVADMDFESPREVQEAIMDRVKHGVYGYTIELDSLFEAVTKWVSRRHNWTIEREWIVFTPGVMPGILGILQAITRPGDKVILQSPVYTPFFRAVRNSGCHVLNNQLKYENNRYTMNFPDLEEKAKDPRTRALILCNPHNPVGRVWTREELSTVGKICLENDVVMISDEIHSDLIYKEYKHIPLASICDEFAENSITCIAPSKTFNLAGLNTAFLVIPDSRVRREFQNMSLPKRATIFGGIAAEAAYTYGDNWLDALLDYLDDNRRLLAGYLKARTPQIKVVEPEGTYLVWLDCRQLGMDNDGLEKFMLEKAGIWVNQGYSFGSGGDGFIRMNIGCPRPILEKALGRLNAAVNSL